MGILGVGHGQEGGVTEWNFGKPDLLFGIWSNTMNLHSEVHYKEDNIGCLQPQPLPSGSKIRQLQSYISKIQREKYTHSFEK